MADLESSGVGELADASSPFGLASPTEEDTGTSQPLSGSRRRHALPSPALEEEPLRTRDMRRGTLAELPPASDAMSEAIRNRRKFAHEDDSSPNWAKHRKHVFILTSAGRPVYTRYGDEDKLAAFMGLLSAFFSSVSASDDQIRELVAFEHSFVFHEVGPFYYVAVSRSHEPPSHVRLLLQYIHILLVSILTQPFIDKVQERPNFDVRRMLGTNAEQLIDSLTLRMDSCDFSFFLGAARPLRLSPSIRATVGSIVVKAKQPDVIFGLVVARGSLVSLVRPSSALHPIDLNLILNVIRSSTSIKDSELWVPMCLPKYNDSGHIHLYARSLALDLVLVYVVAAAEKFFEIKLAADSVAEEFESTATLAAMIDAMAAMEYDVGAVGVAPLRHFVYKSVTTRQYTAPVMDGNYSSDKEKKRLFRMYQNLYDQLSAAKSTQIIYQASSKETMLAWVTTSFELIVTLGPLDRKSSAISACNHVLRWIKDNEESLFISNSPTW